MMSTSCLFCRMIAGEIPHETVLETDRILAFKDISPQSPIHVLMIHKHHTANLLETDNPDTLAELMIGVQSVARQLKLSDFRVVMNNGAEAGQSVFHLHAHLMAGRSFGWPPG